MKMDARLAVLDAERDTESTMACDAHAELDVAAFIRERLRDHPAQDSAVAMSLACWARSLMLDGQARLEAAGLRPLRAVE